MEFPTIYYTNIKIGKSPTIFHTLLMQLSFFFMGFLVLCGGHFVLEEQYRKISRLIK
jgi:hypothetical protein